MIFSNKIVLLNILVMVTIFPKRCTQKDPYYSDTYLVTYCQKEFKGVGESLSLVLVINDAKLLMPCVKCFELGISNTCDEGVWGKEWWPQDHKRDGART
jgi:hypothetical protein